MKNVLIRIFKSLLTVFAVIYTLFVPLWLLSIPYWVLTGRDSLMNDLHKFSYLT
jgi:hypothetical protein